MSKRILNKDVKAMVNRCMNVRMRVCVCVCDKIS